MEADARLERIAHRLSEAVYGTILATTVVVATQDHAGSIGDALIIVVVTSVVFWMAHVYAKAVGLRIVVRRPVTRAELARIARDEWPMLQSGVPVIVPLLLGWMGVLEPETAGWLAVLIGVAALFAYGALIGWREDLGRWRTVGSSLTTGSFGLVILALKVFVH